MSKIVKVKARQVYDSRGNPTVEAEVYTLNSSASAICPSGASTGTYEAFEKRDKNNKKYLGKSVLTAVSIVNTIISNKLNHVMQVHHFVDDPNHQYMVFYLIKIWVQQDDT